MTLELTPRAIFLLHSQMKRAKQHDVNTTCDATKDVLVCVLKTSEMHSFAHQRAEFYNKLRLWVSIHSFLLSEN